MAACDRRVPAHRTGCTCTAVRGQDYSHGWALHRVEGSDWRLCRYQGGFQGTGHRTHQAVSCCGGRRGKRDSAGVRGLTMRFMMLMIPKGYEQAKPGAMPDPERVAAM